MFHSIFPSGPIEIKIILQWDQVAHELNCVYKEQSVESHHFTCIQNEGNWYPSSIEHSLLPWWINQFYWFFAIPKNLFLPSFGNIKQNWIQNCILRIRAMYEVKNSKICNFWMFWPVIQLIFHLFQSKRVIDQNIQKCCICLMHSRYH